MDFGSFKIKSIHQRSLEVFDSSVLSFQQAFKLQIWLSSVEKHNIYVNIISVFMKKVFEENWHWFKSNVSTYNNVSKIGRF